MATYNAPPDNYILEVIDWLRGDVYPNMLNEPFNDRAMAVWVAGSRGYIAIWQTNGHNDDPPTKHADAMAQVLRNINNTKNPPSQEERPLNGQLQVEGLTFRDNLGYVLPVLCHFGEAFAAYARGRRADVLAELRAIKDAGYHGIRFWDVLGYHDKSHPSEPVWTAWHNRGVSPVGFTSYSGEWVNPHDRYYDELASFLRDVRALGLKVHHSRGDLNGFTWDQIKQHVQLVGEVQKAVGLDVVMVNEACNESWQNGVPNPDHLKELCRLMPPSTIRGTSCADDGYGGETPEALNRLKFQVAMIHGYRGGESVNRIAHIHALYNTLAEAGVPGWQGEPAGPDSSVQTEGNVEALCLMAAMALSVKQGWVNHPANGAFWNGTMTASPGFWEVPRVAGLLPRDIMTWDVIHGGDRFRGTRVFAAPTTHDWRVDQMFKPGTRQFQAIVYGKPGTYRVPVERSFNGVIIHPVTQEKHPLLLNAPGTIDIAFDRGRIIQGELL